MSVDTLVLRDRGWNAPVPVHIIGLDGVLNLNQIAAAGGTEQAYDVASGGDSAQMTAALLDIVDQYYDL